MPLPARSSSGDVSESVVVAAKHPHNRTTVSKMECVMQQTL
jgi:hypothetical protein